MTTIPYAMILQKLIPIGAWLLFIMGSFSAHAQIISCQKPQEFMENASARSNPRHVLLIPLLKSYQGRPERWPEQAAKTLQHFYRHRFRSTVVWLANIRKWQDYYREIERLQSIGASFERIIFIGHGGFDGPILSPAIIRNEFTRKGTEGRAIRILESQPGLQEILSIHYRIDQNQEFSQFIASHWEDLAIQTTADVRRILAQQENQLTTPDTYCLQHLCPQPVSSPSLNQPDHSKICETVCRIPLFLSHSGQHLAPERFSKFSQSLNDLSTTHSLIILGMCNPGSTVPEPETTWDTTGTLTRSDIANGPHLNYAQLLATTTRRQVVGPIGPISAAAIVARIKAFEIDKTRRVLHRVSPARDCAPGETETLSEIPPSLREEIAPP
jgi:hypothetical protein